jgi:hypothetical protein
MVVFLPPRQTSQLPQVRPLDQLAQVVEAQAQVVEAQAQVEVQVEDPSMVLSCPFALLRLPCTALLLLEGLHLALPLTSTQQGTPCLDVIYFQTLLSLFGVELDVTLPQLVACTTSLHRLVTPQQHMDLIPTLTYHLAVPTMNWLALFLVKLLLQLQD